MTVFPPPASRPAPARLCLGVVTGPHGMGGLVRVKSFTAEPDSFAAYGPLSDVSGKRWFEVTVEGHSKDQVIARITDVNSRTEAEALKGQELYIERTALPAVEEEDSFYHADLIGLSVETPDGLAFGKVRAVHDFGAGDMLEITLFEGGDTSLPFTHETVPVVDVAAGRLVVNLPDEVEAKP